MHHYLEAISHTYEANGLTIGFQTKNSSDLERAPGARSIAEEFFVWNPIVIELQRCEVNRFSHSRCNFWDPESVEMGSNGDVQTKIAL